MDRRLFLSSTAAATAAVTSQVAVGATERPSLRGPYLDLTTAKGNLVLRARMGGNLDETKIKYGSTSGIVSGVVPGEKIRDLFGFEVVGVTRLAKQPDGSFRRYHREAIFYTDLETGEILREYDNPYLNERVKVVDVINDPWNETVQEFERGGPVYGGLNKAAEQVAPKPEILNWLDAGAGLIIAQRNVNLYYKAALQPDKWPRESAGPMNQVSECYTYVIRLADAQNPKLTSVEGTGTWTRVTPWLPWMLMGQAPGHTLYQGATLRFDGINMFKKHVREYTEKHYPHMLVPPSPESWQKPNLSSLENYALTQKPAPAKKN